MADFNLDNEPRKVLRRTKDGYSVYDYPKAEAMAVAEKAAEQFKNRFNSVMPSVGLAGQDAARPHRYIERRGSPFLNFTFPDGKSSFGVVLENNQGGLALELHEYKGKVPTPDGVYSRWDWELRTPSWDLVASEAELV